MLEGSKFALLGNSKGFWRHRGISRWPVPLDSECVCVCSIASDTVAEVCRTINTVNAVGKSIFIAETSFP